MAEVVMVVVLLVGSSHSGWYTQVFQAQSTAFPSHIPHSYHSQFEKTRCDQKLLTLPIASRRQYLCYFDRIMIQ